MGFDETPYDRLISVEKWKVNLHLVYDCQDSEVTVHAVSDWTGTLDTDDVGDVPGLWAGVLDVAVDGVSQCVMEDEDHEDTVTITAKGTDKYGFNFNLDKEGYEIHQGYCGTSFGTTIYHCPKRGDTTSSNSGVTYSEAWTVKVPLPEQGTTLSGSATVTRDSPGQSDELPKGATITVKWEFDSIREREVKYRETALDVAAMNYPGKAVDPHIFVIQGRSWLPHANFAGEVWVDGVNTVEIHPGPAPLGFDGRPQNVTSDYGIKREVRSWDLGKPGENPWFPDSGDIIQDWIDNPGVLMDAGPPPGWNKRVLDEFLVQVFEHPEIGRVYAAFVMEIRKNAYRIRYSDPMFISEEQYDSIKASSAPFFGYPFTDKDEGWVELMQDPTTKEWKPRPPVP